MEWIYSWRDYKGVLHLTADIVAADIALARGYPIRAERVPEKNERDMVVY
jgi:hypothetical protein